MSLPDAELLAGSYLVCLDCQIGKHIPNQEIESDSIEATDVAKGFGKDHVAHNLQFMASPEFLERFIGSGFTDPDHPDLEPIKTTFGEKREPAPGAPFGTPGRDKAIEANRRRWNRPQEERPVFVQEDEPRTVRDLFRLEDAVRAENPNTPQEIFAKYLDQLNRFIDTGIPSRVVSIEDFESEVPVGTINVTFSSKRESNRLFVIQANLPELNRIREIFELAIQATLVLACLNRFGGVQTDACLWLAKQMIPYVRQKLRPVLSNEWTYLLQDTTP